jgi:hypothetical protein
VISGDGDQVAFESIASNLALQQDDSNGVQDVFLWRSGASLLVSHVPESVFRTGNGTSRSARIGLDGGVEVLLGGSLATFQSAALNLIDTPINGGTNIYFHGGLVMADGFESGDSRPGRSRCLEDWRRPGRETERGASPNFR